MRRGKQVSRATTPSPQKPPEKDKGKGGKKGTKRKAPDPPASSPLWPAPRRGGNHVSNAAQDAIDEARVMADVEEEVGATPSPPPQPRGAGGLTERQKRAAEEQKARNDAKVIADLNAKLAAMPLHPTRSSSLRWRMRRRGKSQAVVKR